CVCNVYSWLLVVGHLSCMRKMAALSIWFFIVLVSVLVSISEAYPPLDSFAVQKNQALLERAKEILKANMQRKDAASTFMFTPARLSPGGPDPLHH
ncbi:hypothetical protein Dimus_018878, partial [Dionaea muscipula]